MILGVYSGREEMRTEHTGATLLVKVVTRW